MYNSRLITQGEGSPLIHTIGSITVIGTLGETNGTHMIVVEGKGELNLKDNSNLTCTYEGNRGDRCSILLNQTTSGSKETSTFNCKNSNIYINSSSAPIFSIKNTDANINLEECIFSNKSSTFLNVSENLDLSTGKIFLNIKNQNIEGNINADSNSDLTINMTNSTIKGIINGGKAADDLRINIDKDSTIILTGNSYYTELNNDDDSGRNIYKNHYNFTKYGNDGEDDYSDDSSDYSSDYSTNSTDNYEHNDYRNNTRKDSDSGGMSGWAIFGIVLGIVAVVACIITGIAYACK